MCVPMCCSSSQARGWPYPTSVMYLGRGCASPSCCPCQCCHAFPSLWAPDLSQFSLLEGSTGGLIFSFALLKLPKKICDIAWLEGNKIQSVMNRSELCCFSGAGSKACMELGWWLGWWGRVHSSEKALCDEDIWAIPKKLPQKWVF